MKTLVNIIKKIVIVILSVVLLLNIYIIVQTKTHPDKVPNVFGYKPFIVLSGSMESTIHVGDLVFVKIINPEELKENDIIAFRDKENLVTTHRIKGLKTVNGETCYITKGDANNTEDQGLVCQKDVEGKYVSRIAKIGNAILFIQEPLGFAVMLMSVFIVLLLVYVVGNKKSNDTIEMTEEERKAFEEFKKSKIEKK